MSNPIKPPSSDLPLQQIDELSSGAGVEKPSAAVPEALEAQPDSVQQVAGAADSADPVRVIAEALRSGEINPDRAVQMLVERALDSAPLAALDEQGRQQVEGLLRAALLDDPTLAAIVKDLEHRSG